jgi:hypothetical protein
MTDFATGVQRWCSCLDCVLTSRSCGRRLLLARTLVGLHRDSLASHAVHSRSGYGMSASRSASAHAVT